MGNGVAAHRRIRNVLLYVCCPRKCNISKSNRVVETSILGIRKHDSSLPPFISTNINFAWNYIYFEFLKRDEKKDKKGDSQEKSAIYCKGTLCFYFSLLLLTHFKGRHLNNSDK